MSNKIKITQKETDVRVGKEGLSEAVIKHIRTMLKKRKILKIKFLPSASADKKELASKLEQALPCKIVHKIGFVIIIQRQ